MKVVAISHHKSFKVVCQYRSFAGLTQRNHIVQEGAEPVEENVTPLKTRINSNGRIHADGQRCAIQPCQAHFSKETDKMDTIQELDKTRQPIHRAAAVKKCLISVEVESDRIPDILLF